MQIDEPARGKLADVDIPVDGGYWEVLVDLFTVEEGCSDLALFVRVYPREGSYVFQILSVHVE